MIYIKNIEEPSLNVREVLRYAGVNTNDEKMKDTILSLAEEVKSAFTYKVCYSIFPVNIKGENIEFSTISLKSEKLAESLKSSSHILVFAATVGVGIDRLINKYSYTSPSKAFLLQALGSERIESLCNAFCKDIKGVATHRFSPGYRDLSLDCQKDIFALLDCRKNIGLTLNDSMIMSPMKSVTAFV